MSEQGGGALKRGCLWWIGGILAALGIFGGPLEIANLFAGLIEWHGPTAYLVNFWETNVSHQFAVIFGFAARLLHLPEPPKLLVSYLTLGIIMSAGMWRGLRIAYGGGPQDLIGFMPTLLLTIIAWPLALLLLPWLAWETFFVGEFGFEPSQEYTASLRQGIGMCLAPFLIFLALFVVNVLTG